MGKDRQGMKPDESDLSSQNPPSKLKKRYQHDEFCKDNLRDLGKARKFLRWLLKEGAERLDLNRLELSSESFLDEDLKKLYADVLYRIPIKDSDENIVVFVLIELKTESDKWTVFQQAKYIIRIWDEEYRRAKTEKRLDQFRLPMVIPVILHHGENRFIASTELSDQVRTLEDLKPYTLNVKSLLCDVTILHEEEFPADIELCVMFMMLQAVFSKDIAERLMRIYKKLYPNRHEPGYQRLWQDCLHYALSSAKHFTGNDCKTIITEIRNTGDTIMSTTEFVSAADQLIEEGIAIGEARGETIGVAKGEVLAFLRARFKKVPATTESIIRSMTDLTALESLVAHAENCQSLEEFEKALK
jgi:hypothetical protein